MPIILSQRIDLVSDYADKPYFRYHFPKRYRNQVKTGDVFVYYQGDSKKLENRYYFGWGVIAEIMRDYKGDGGRPLLGWRGVPAESANSLQWFRAFFSYWDNKVI